MLTEFQKRQLQVAEMVAAQMQAKLNDPRGTIVDEQVYWYDHPPTNIPALSSVVVNVPIQSDADFDAYYLSSSSFTTSTGVINGTPFLTMQITDSGTGRTFFSNPAFVPLVTGQQGFPYILQNVRQFKAKSNIQFTYNNLSDADLTVQTIFAGTKVFYKGN